jgi:hypothetical protein
MLEFFFLCIFHYRMRLFVLFNRQPLQVPADASASSMSPVIMRAKVLISAESSLAGS